MVWLGQGAAVTVRLGQGTAALPRVGGLRSVGRQIRPSALVGLLANDAPPLDPAAPCRSPDRRFAPVGAARILVVLVA